MYLLKSQKNGTALYAASGGNFYSSSDTGSTWKTTAISGLSSATWISANPFKAGELWVSGDGGIFHSTDYGNTFAALPSCTRGWRTAIGAPKTTGGTPSIYAAATVGGLSTVYRSDDQVNWIRITDSKNGFGSMSTVILAADPRIYKVS
jgi:xyloglucan-specific exo-beta-1,4-glucanase